MQTVVARWHDKVCCVYIIKMTACGDLALWSNWCIRNENPMKYNSRIVKFIHICGSLKSARMPVGGFISCSETSVYLMLFLVFVTFLDIRIFI